MRDLRAMGETNVMRDRLRRPMPPRHAGARRARSTPTASAPPTGGCAATFEVIFLTGWAPAPDQPQPLRPGSARARLADALGAAERSAGEAAGD